MKSNVAYELVEQTDLKIAVTDGDIARILHLRESKSLLKKRLAELDENLEQAEFDVIKRIEDGAPVHTTHQLNVRETQRHFPSWKDAFISVAGINAAARVLANTKPQIYKSLVISE